MAQWGAALIFYFYWNFQGVENDSYFTKDDKTLGVFIFAGAAIVTTTIISF